MCAVLAVGDVGQGNWYFDSGATTHMAKPRWNLHGKQEISCQVSTANKTSMMARVKGVISLDCVEGPVDVQEVLEVPDLAANLLSVSKICSKGFTVKFTASGCTVLDENGQVFASGTAEGGLYRLNRQVQNAFLSSELEVWHRRLGHLNVQSLKQLKQMVTGFQLNKMENLNCVACFQGKHSRDPFPNSEEQASRWSSYIRIYADHLKYLRWPVVDISLVLLMMQLGKFLCIPCGPKIKYMKLTKILKQWLNDKLVSS